jgi:UDP-N-acetyl-D-mannosaminuronate dehydrogenase
MNIDTNQVLEAAATKWNFPFKPGLVGGHCRSLLFGTESARIGLSS